MGKSLKIFSYPLCGTCKKAIKWLELHAITYELLDITKSPPDEKLLAKAMSEQTNRKGIFNTSGKSYREMGVEKYNDMDDNEALKSLVKDPKLIKRPLVILNDGKILVGFKATVWEKVLL